MMDVSRWMRILILVLSMTSAIVPCEANYLTDANNISVHRGYHKLQKSKKLKKHPFVISSETDYIRLITSDNPLIGLSLQQFERTVKSELGRLPDFTQIYRGCSLDIYLKKLTYEDGGAARIASDLSLYGYLTGLGRGYGDPETGKLASKAAESILAKWSSEAFRPGGHPIERPDQFCAGTDEHRDINIVSSVGLQLGRGMPYIVQAYDLLLAGDALSVSTQETVSGMVKRLTALIISATNERFQTQNLDCNRYSNHVSIQLAGLASAAQLLGDTVLTANIAGQSNSVLAINIKDQISNAIYGDNEKLRQCYKNGSNDNFAQTDTPVPGEIIDRYRAGEGQTLGYPLISLDHLLLTAEILNRSGVDLSHIEREDTKSMRRASEYYTQYFQQFLRARPSRVVASEMHKYPGSNQYDTKIVSRGPATIEGADRLLVPFLRAARMYPQSKKLRELMQTVGGFSAGNVPFGALDSLSMHELLYFDTK